MKHRTCNAQRWQTRRFASLVVVWIASHVPVASKVAPTIVLSIKARSFGHCFRSIFSWRLGFRLSSKTWVFSARPFHTSHAKRCLRHQCSSSTLAVYCRPWPKNPHWLCLIHTSFWNALHWPSNAHSWGWLLSVDIGDMLTLAYSDHVPWQKHKACIAAHLRVAFWEERSDTDFCLVSWFRGWIHLWLLNSNVGSMVAWVLLLKYDGVFGVGAFGLSSLSSFFIFFRSSTIDLYWGHQLTRCWLYMLRWLSLIQCFTDDFF